MRDDGDVIILPDHYTKETVGPKAFNIGQMDAIPKQADEIHAPHLSLGLALYKKTLEGSSNRETADRIRALVNSLSEKLSFLSDQKIQAYLNQLDTAIVSLRIPTEILQTISNEIIKNFGPGLIFLRSSAEIEDLDDDSVAGMYVSIGAVDPTNLLMLEEGIKKIWASIYSKKAYVYRRKTALQDEDMHMAIIAHKMVYAEYVPDGVPNQYSFVVHTYALDGGSKNIIVEVVQGLGKAVVDGEDEYPGTPYRFSIDRETKEISVLAYANKDYRVVVAGNKEIKVLTDYTKDIFTHANPTRDRILMTIVNGALAREKYFKDKPQDTEATVYLTKEGYAACFLQTRDQQIVRRDVNDKASSLGVSDQLEDSFKNSKNTNTGGIDLTTERIKLEMQGGDDGFFINVDPDQILRYQAAPGFLPVIMGIESAVDISAFLGLVSTKMTGQ